MKLAPALTDTGLGRLLRRYAQFCVVGGSGVVVDVTVLYLLASPTMLGWNLSLSKAIAAEVALVNNFVWNELWTFRDLLCQ
jgi:dolichol-phosphate mannosyltransferase